MLKQRFNRIYENNLTAGAIIDAVQPELDFCIDTLANHFRDTFAKTATESGISRWENVLGIVPNPSIEALEFRRERILNRLISGIPYTERALHIIMDNIMGAGNWSYTLDYNNYILVINSLRHGKNWVSEMDLILDKIIPANILYYLYIRYNQHNALSDYTHAHLASFSHIQLREEELI